MLKNLYFVEEKKPTLEWSKCKIETPENDDLSIIESNPIVDLPNPQSFH